MNSEHVHRLIAHGRALQRQAQAAIDAGDHDRGLALLADAELLARDVKQHVDELESDELDFAEARLCASAPSKPDEPLSASRGGATKQIGSLGMGLGAGFAVGALIAEI